MTMTQKKTALISMLTAIPVLAACAVFAGTKIAESPATSETDSSSSPASSLQVVLTAPENTQIIIQPLPKQNPTNSQEKNSTGQPKIQIAILLDNSGSMEGLINQARTFLWSVVTDCSKARIDGQMPRIEIALYHYGDARLHDDSGYIQQLSPFTTDLDIISEKLFALNCCGGSEYCGQALMTALDQLKWSSGPKDLKIIYIAGNEPFTQGSVSYEDACRKANQKHVTVNTILCGNWGPADDWKKAASISEGKFLQLDHNELIPDIKTPYDQKIMDLNEQLNLSAVPYGSLAEDALKRQAAQDSNTFQMNTSAVNSRFSLKTSDHYQESTSSWDLVSAAESDDFDIRSVNQEDLPDAMKNMSDEEKKNYLQNKVEQRKKLMQELDTLLQKQKEFITQEIEKQKQDTEADNLESLLLQTTRDQAIRRGYQFEE